VYIYYIKAAGNSISSHLGSSCQDNRYGTENVYGTVRCGPSITDKITPVGSLSSSQPGGPPCWASSLVFPSLGISLKVGDVPVGLENIFSFDNCNLVGKKQQRRHQASGNEPGHTIFQMQKASDMQKLESKLQSN
jgi:hypothetical protein